MLAAAVSMVEVEQSSGRQHGRSLSNSALEKAGDHALKYNGFAGEQVTSPAPSIENESGDMRSVVITTKAETPEDGTCLNQRHETSEKSATDSEELAVLSEGNEPSEDDRTHARYRNSLHPAVGYLDLANALDFPANVWNTIPAPLYALVLTALGGSIAILSVGFAICDYRRSRWNVRFLQVERIWVKTQLTSPAGLKSEVSLVLQAWLDMSTRELGWELIDRILLDVSMGIAGILVGTGTIMAIRGDIPAVFKASNLMSGYIGNSLAVIYAFINLLWSCFMYNRARKHRRAMRDATALSTRLRHAMIRHGRKYEWYAILNGVTVVVSSAGSMISATMWQGYVVLVPCVMMSVYCNSFWRKRLGYDRDSAQTWLKHGMLDIHARTEVLADTLADTSRRGRKYHAGSLDLVYEERFLLELYGCYLTIAQGSRESFDEKTEETET